MHACRLNPHKNTTRSLKFHFPMMQQEALICCLNLQEHIIIIITIRTTKTPKKNPQMMKQNLISSWKTYITVVKCFWKCGVFFWVRGIKDHIIRFLKFRVTTTKFGQFWYYYLLLKQQSLLECWSFSSLILNEHEGLTTIIVKVDWFCFVFFVFCLFLQR